MKRCCRCREEKPLTEFNRARSQADGHQAHCRACAAAYYQGIREHALPRIKEAKRLQRMRMERYVWDYLTLHPCIDCGESDPIVLEFDHVTGKKVASISRMVDNVASVPAIKGRDGQMCGQVR
jgi:hypothetical protein